MKEIITEICSDSINSAKVAERAGGDRIELCQGLSLGGLTPSFALISECCKNLSIPVFVLIRPRSGDFYYSGSEYGLILEDIRFCRNAGASGIVAGFLNPDGSIDKQRLKEAVCMAKPMEVTFHRAFDMCRDWENSLEEIINCGCDRILTSGLHNTAAEGKDIIRKMVEKAGRRIKIVAASGITEKNVVEILNYTRCKEVHFSAKKMVESSMSYYNPLISGKEVENMGSGHYETSEESLRGILSAIRNNLQTRFEL
jgi:copper homeostasis protein